MIIPGRDRYCRKVTRRRGNGLQPARFDERGERRRRTQRKMERGREWTIKMKEKETSEHL